MAAEFTISPMGPRVSELGPRESAVLARFAETMAPGGDLPAAEREIPVSASMREISRRLPRRQVRFMRLGILAFEWLSFPRRFSRQPPARRAELLEGWARSHWTLPRELLMLMKTLYSLNYLRDERVRAIVGYTAECRIDGPEPEVASLGNLTPADDGEDCDVAIVGSGAGGAAVAVALAEAGLDVLVLESGPYADRKSYPADPLEASVAYYRDAGLTIAEGLPSIPIPSARMVGGTTVINSGTCFAATDGILERWRTEFGIGWARSLDQHFDEAERMLDVRQLDLETLGRNGRLVAEGAAAIGAAGAPLHRNAGRCVQCSSCPQGCKLDAKRAMHVSYLPRAVTAGARIRSGVDVRRVVFESGRASGLECVIGDGGGGSRPFRVRARKAVISAGGSLGTPELLLRSGLEHPGIGRNLRLHPSCWVGGRFADPVRGWEGVMQSYGVETWAPDGVMLEATFTPLAFCGQWLPGVGAEHRERILAFDRIASNGVQVRDESSSGRVGLGADDRLRVSYRLRRDEARKIVFGIARAAEIFFAAGAEEVYPQVSGNPILSRGDVGAFESRPPATRDLRIESFHPMGSCRIGADAATAPADTDGAVRGVRGLYVADASVFPTALGVNPMMTVIACASQLGQQLAERLSSGRATPTPASRSGPAGSAHAAV